jgi:hypothetical protein
MDPVVKQHVEYYLQSDDGQQFLQNELKTRLRSLDQEVLEEVLTSVVRGCDLT